VTALDRAFAFVQINVVAVRIAKHLNFDVAGFQHVFFDQDAVVTERRLGFVDAGGEILGHSLSSKATRRPLPPPPAEALIITG
jgi:hypothetical protein